MCCKRRYKWLVVNLSDLLNFLSYPTAWYTVISTIGLFGPDSSMYRPPSCSWNIVAAKNHSDPHWVVNRSLEVANYGWLTEVVKERRTVATLVWSERKSQYLTSNAAIVSFLPLRPLAVFGKIVDDQLLWHTSDNLIGDHARPPARQRRVAISASFNRSCWGKILSWK